MRGLLAFLASSSALVGLAVASLDHSTVSVHRLDRRAGTTALKCKNGFTLDTTKTQCICRPPKLLNVDRTKCLDSCSSGSYPAGDNTCAKCPTAFAKCSSATVATGCANGSFLSAGTCVKTCPVGTWADDAPTKNRCRKCADPRAASCSDRGATSTACSTGYLLNGKCLALTEIPSGYYADQETHVAEKCDANVTSCKCRGVGCALSCGKNKKKDQYLLTPKGTCDMHCPKSWYGNKALGVCLACDSSTLTCDQGGAPTCAKDSAGTQLYLTPTRKCVLSWKGPPGYYADTNSATFKKCAGGATSCTGPDECDARSCDVDAAGEPLFFRPCGWQKLRRRNGGNGGGGSCVRVDECHERQWADLASHTCRDCDGGVQSCKGNGQGQATGCGLFAYLTVDGNCVTKTTCVRSGAFYASDDGHVCRACDPGVASCTANGIGGATSCGIDANGSQLYLNEGSCIPSAACPAGTFADQDGNTCASCVARFGKDAATCTVDEVTSCTTGVRLNGVCVDSCPAEVTVLVGDECVACSEHFPGSSTCDAAGPTSCARDDDGATLYLSNGRCVTADKCSSGTYGNDGTGSCESCSAFGSLAETCDWQGALSCIGNSILYERGCFEECPVGTVRDGSTCRTGLLLDVSTSTCVASCRLLADNVNSASYESSGTCKSCGGLEVLLCSADGAQLCRAPYVIATGGTKCITAQECVDDTPRSFPQYGLGWWGTDDRYGTCQQCPSFGYRTPDKTGCVY
ncbi:hypothetical protein JCM3775_003736 [Rhodotorula graminis]